MFRFSGREVEAAPALRALLVLRLLPLAAGPLGCRALMATILLI